MKTSKIFLGLLSIFYLLLVAIAFNFGDAAIGTTVMAIPLAIPVIKSTAITDSDALAAELNRVFGSLSEDIRKTISDEFASKGNLTAGELDTKLKALGLDADTIKTINETIVAQGLEISKAQGEKNAPPVSLRSYVKNLFSRDGLLDDIRKAFTNHGALDLSAKAVGNITTSNVTTDSGGNALLDMLNADEIADLRLANAFIEDFASVTTTNKPVHTYVDYVPGEGDMEFIAQGGTKPQLDLDVVVKTIGPVKAAGYEVLTEEAITDIPRMESNARGLLFRKYLLKRQNGILFGDGTANQPTGVTAIAAAFNPASWISDKVVNPNLSDCVIACANQIYTTLSYADDVEFMPNVAFVSPGDFAGMRLAKDKNGQYMFPSFSIFGDKTIDGIRIVAKNKIPAGKILIGDFKKLNIVDYVGYSIRLGWINDQFIKNLFTMLGEGRFFVYVKTLDQRAFIYDDIANVKEGIAAPQA